MNVIYFKGFYFCLIYFCFARTEEGKCQLLCQQNKLFTFHKQSRQLQNTTHTITKYKQDILQNLDPLNNKDKSISDNSMH